MSQAYSINYDSAIASASKIEEARRGIDTNFSNLRAKINERLGSPTWSGDAANRFKKQWNEFANSFDVCLSELKGVHSKVDAAYQSYQAFDQQ